MFAITGATGGSVIATKLLAWGEKIRVIGRDGSRLDRFVQKGVEAFVAGWRRAKACVLPLSLLTRGWRNASLSWLTYGKRRQRAREGDSKAARRGQKTARKCKKDTK